MPSLDRLPYPPFQGGVALGQEGLRGEQTFQTRSGGTTPTVGRIATADLRVVPLALLLVQHIDTRLRAWAIRTSREAGSDSSDSWRIISSVASKYHWSGNVGRVAAPCSAMRFSAFAAVRTHCGAGSRSYSISSPNAASPG